MNKNRRVVTGGKLKVKMKLGAILALNSILKNLIDDAELKIDSKTKFKLLTIMMQFKPHVDNFNIIRDDKIREYGTEDEKNNIKIDTENEEVMKKFQDSLNEVLNEVVDLNIKKVKADDIFDKGIPAEYLAALYELIDE